MKEISFERFFVHFHRLGEMLREYYGKRELKRAKVSERKAHAGKNKGQIQITTATTAILNSLLELITIKFHFHAVE